MSCANFNALFPGKRGTNETCEFLLRSVRKDLQACQNAESSSTESSALQEVQVQFLRKRIQRFVRPQAPRSHPYWYCIIHDSWKTLKINLREIFNKKLRSEAIQVHAMRQELYAALLAGKPPGQDSRHEAFARLQAKTRQDLRLRRLWFLYWRCSVSFFLHFFKENWILCETKILINIFREHYAHARSCTHQTAQKSTSSSPPSSLFDASETIPMKMTSAF